MNVLKALDFSALREINKTCSTVRGNGCGTSFIQERLTNPRMFKTPLRLQEMLSTLTTETAVDFCVFCSLSVCVQVLTSFVSNCKLHENLFYRAQY